MSGSTTPKEPSAKAERLEKTTMSEAQLIGRGARYCPFRLDDNQPLYQRKYDDVAHELRICEELFYHAAHNPKYISELNKALQKIGLRATRDELETKHSAKKSTPSIIKKRKQQNSHNLDKSIRERIYKKKIFSGDSSISKIFDIETSRNVNTVTEIYYLNSFGTPILRKALNKLPFYRFSNLQRHFPHLKSISEFLTSDDFANNIKVEIEGSQEDIKHPNNQMKLEIALDVFDEISKAIV